MSQFRFDDEYIKAVRKELMRPTALSEKIIWWEAMMRGSLQSFYEQMAEVIWNIDKDDFDWGPVDQEGWLLDKQTKVEVQAYRRGAVAVAALIQRSLSDALGMHTDSIVEALDERASLEERISDFIVGAASKSEDGIAAGQEPHDQLPDGKAHQEAQGRRRQQAVDGDSGTGE